MSDMGTPGPPGLNPYGRSFVLPIVRTVIQLWSYVSPYDWAKRLLWKHHERIPFWFAETYVLGWLVILLGALFSTRVGDVPVPWFVLVIFRLSDILIGWGRIVFIEREEREDDVGYYILARNLNRWVILTILNFVEIVIVFAILYLGVGDQFSCPGIGDRITALYQSLLTFTTLGYGEFHPKTNVARLYVIAQLSCFMAAVVLVGPIVFSAVRAREKPPANGAK